MKQEQRNTFLDSWITVIDVDDTENWLPLFNAVLGIMRKYVIRIDITSRGYHVVLRGNYPNVQFLVNADMKANAPKRLFTMKKRKAQKWKPHVVINRIHESVLDMVYPLYTAKPQT